MSEIRTKWYLGSMNDGLFIIDAPPSPAGTDVQPYLSPKGPELVLNITDLPGKKALMVVDGHNAAVAGLNTTVDRLTAENARLREALNIQKAQSAFRGRILQEIRDKVGPLVMSLEDEGDRIYLGSTNDKEWLVDIEETIFEVDDEVWATLNREEKDPYAELFELRTVIVPALEGKSLRLREALRPFAEFGKQNVALAIAGDGYVWTTSASPSFGPNAYGRASAALDGDGK